MSRVTCVCGAPLIDDVTPEGVRPVGSDQTIPFRRDTDFVVCPACLRDYSVRSLIAQASDAEVIDLLERLAARAEEASQD